MEINLRAFLKIKTPEGPDDELILSGLSNVLLVSYNRLSD